MKGAVEPELGEARERLQGACLGEQIEQLVTQAGGPVSYQPRLDRTTRE